MWTRLVARLYDCALCLHQGVIAILPLEEGSCRDRESLLQSPLADQSLRGLDNSWSKVAGVEFLCTLSGHGVGSPGNVAPTNGIEIDVVIVLFQCFALFSISNIDIFVELSKVRADIQFNRLKLSLIVKLEVLSFGCLE